MIKKELNSRRKFLIGSASISVGFIALSNLFSNNNINTQNIKQKNKVGYGKLIKDPNNLLNLPKGFTYKVISKTGTIMDDGLLVPGKMDAMGTFPLDKDRCIIVRNHENAPEYYEESPFAKDYSLLKKAKKEYFYDYGFGKSPGLGGTSTIVFNTKTQKVEKEFMSLVGTEDNCAGGITPWKTWITCEETVETQSDIREKDHGYCFEVKVTPTPQLNKAIPLKAMGRFNHEAVSVDPKTGIVYLTEDRHDSCIYRFIPNVYGDLQKGGKLQALCIKNNMSLDTRNWLESKIEIKLNQEFETYWIDLDNVESPEDDLRFRANKKGAAIFARGEGMWFGDNEVYWCCTNGGKAALGQIFKYIPSKFEGSEKEENSPGKLSLFVESKNSNMLQNCDNMTIAVNGDLIVCEDTEHPFLRGITKKGEIYNIAENIGASSEFAGAVFSPDYSTLFVNIQHAGLCLAIVGPWRKE